MALMFEPLRKYARFSGRARRLEYWSFHLFVAAVLTALVAWFLWAVGPSWSGGDVYAMEETVSANPAARWPLIALALFQLFVIIPSLAVSIRRLHDSDKSGWWILLGLIPAGQFVLFIFYLLDGTRGPNRHGVDPKGRAPQRFG